MGRLHGDESEDVDYSRMWRDDIYTINTSPQHIPVSWRHMEKLNIIGKLHCCRKTVEVSDPRQGKKERLDTINVLPNFVQERQQYIQRKDLNWHHFNV